MKSKTLYTIKVIIYIFFLFISENLFSSVTHQVERRQLEKAGPYCLKLSKEYVTEPIFTDNLTFYGNSLDKQQGEKIKTYLLKNYDSCIIFQKHKEAQLPEVIFTLLGKPYYEIPTSREDVEKCAKNSSRGFYLIAFPNLYFIENDCNIDNVSFSRYLLFNYYNMVPLKGSSILLEIRLFQLFAWEPYGRYWELKAKDFEALKKMNELKISAFEKLLKKTENDPQFAKLYLENRPDSYNPGRRIIKRKPEALEKAWQKFSARWEKENPNLVPKFKIIPLLPESDTQMKK